MARRRIHVGLYDFARRASSRSGVHAGPSARIPAADEGHLCDLGLGKTLEAVRFHTSAINRPRDRRLMRPSKAAPTIVPSHTGIDVAAPGRGVKSIVRAR